jgi:two-component system, OmpR family, phosphate regulon response regulator OmpR
LVRYLGGEGYEVKAVPDGAAMDKQLARDRYDLIVLDLMLPGEDGLAICRRLRGQPNAPTIIMLTAKGDDVDRIVGLEMGADDYLPKPFNPASTRCCAGAPRPACRGHRAPPPRCSSSASSRSTSRRAR